MAPLNLSLARCLFSFYFRLQQISHYVWKCLVNDEIFCFTVVDDFYNSLESLQNKIKINIIMISWTELEFTFRTKQCQDCTLHGFLGNMSCISGICMYVTSNRSTGNDVKKTAFVQVWKFYLLPFSRRHWNCLSLKLNPFHSLSISFCLCIAWVAYWGNWPWRCHGEMIFSAFSPRENWETDERCFVWTYGAYMNWKSLIWANSNFNTGTVHTYIRQIHPGVWEIWKYDLFFAFSEEVERWGALYPSRTDSSRVRLFVITLIVPPDYKWIIIFLRSNSGMYQLLISSLWQEGWKLSKPQ